MLDDLRRLLEPHLEGERMPEPAYLTAQRCDNAIGTDCFNAARHSCAPTRLTSPQELDSNWELQVDEYLPEATVGVSCAGGAVPCTLDFDTTCLRVPYQSRPWFSSRQRTALLHAETLWLGPGCLMSSRTHMQLHGPSQRC